MMVPLVIAIALAQPVEIGDASMLLDPARQAYRAGPFAEEVSIVVRGERTRRDRYSIRVDPGEAGADAARLDLGRLHVYAAERRVVAVHESDPKSYIEWELAQPLTPAALAAFLPPVAAPQWTLACAPDATFSRPLPFLPPVVWMGTEVDPEDADVRLVRGVGESAEIVLTIDPATSRFARLLATLPGEGGTVEMSFQRIDPGDPAGWAIGTEGRTRVKTLAELGPDAGLVGVGDPVPEMIFQRRDLGAWRLRDRLKRGDPTVRNDPSSGAWIALVLFRCPVEGGAEIMADARAGVAAMVGVPRSGRVPPEFDRIYLPTPVAVLELGRYSPDALDEIARAVIPEPREGEVAPALLWSGSTGATIDRFAPDSNAVAVVCAPDATVRAIVPLDGRAADEAGILDELATAMEGAMEGRPAEPPR